MKSTKLPVARPHYLSGVPAPANTFYSGSWCYIHQGDLKGDSLWDLITTSAGERACPLVTARPWETSSLTKAYRDMALTPATPKGTMSFHVSSDVSSYGQQTQETDTTKQT